MDEQTYLKLIQQCERSMYRISLSILWNDADSADAVQQAIFKGWIKRRQLRDMEKFKSWIMAILVNECRNLQRKNLKQANIVDFLMDEAKLKAHARENIELQDAIKGLPEHYRLPILLHYMEGYPVKDIARILDISENRVTERMYRGRRKLEEALNDE